MWMTLMWMTLMWMTLMLAVGRWTECYHRTRELPSLVSSVCGWERFATHQILVVVLVHICMTVELFISSLFHLSHPARTCLGCTMTERKTRRNHIGMRFIIRTGNFEKRSTRGVVTRARRLGEKTKKRNQHHLKEMARLTIGKGKFAVVQDERLVGRA